MRVATIRRWQGGGWGFEGIREIRIPVTPAPSVVDSLRRSPFICRRGGPEITVLDCLQCPRFVNWRPIPAAAAAAVRCLFTDQDRVRDVMNPPEAFVDPDTSVAEAEELALKKDVRHLIVARGDEVVGVACRCDLVRASHPELPVGALASTPPWCVDPDTTLSEVGALFREEGIGMALIVEGDQLAGVITRGDLRRAGCPEDVLGARFCVSCRSSHGVIEHPELGVDICLDCLEWARPGTMVDEGNGD